MVKAQHLAPRAPHNPAGPFGTWRPAALQRKGMVLLMGVDEWFGIVRTKREALGHRFVLQSAGPVTSPSPSPQASVDPLVLPSES